MKDESLFHLSPVFSPHRLPPMLTLLMYLTYTWVVSPCLHDYLPAPFCLFVQTQMARYDTIFGVVPGSLTHAFCNSQHLSNFFWVRFSLVLWPLVDPLVSTKAQAYPSSYTTLTHLLHSHPQGFQTSPPSRLPVRSNMRLEMATQGCMMVTAWKKEKADW